MSNTTFKRYEKKYLITDEKYQLFLQAISSYIEKDKYYNSTICNVYYDTTTSLLIRKSIEKPKYKEKFRIRSYNIPNESDSVFLEIKKKFDGVVYKRREKFLLKNALEFIDNSKEAQNQIQNELKWFLKAYKKLEPKMYISYDRYSYKVKEGSDLRITFDKNILYRTYDLDLKDGVYGKEVIDQNKGILEIKSSKAMPLWLCEIMNHYQIYPTSFSKYGSAYKMEGGYR